MTFVRRAPGRVNLIGEHTDYSLLPVLPFAIQLGVTATAHPTDDQLVRIDSTTIPAPAALRLGTGLDDLDGWHRYAQAAINATGAIGLEISVDSDLPHDGGLSSSSAFTVALVAVIRAARGEPDDVDAVVDAAVTAERATGLAGGTMDQNVIARARREHALRIDFDPFGVQHVRIPESLAFVAAHSGEVADKGGAARQHYNDRAMGCRVAAAHLADRLGVEPRECPVLADVRDAGNDVVARLPASAVVEPGSAPWVPTELVEARAVPVRATAQHVLAEARRVDAAERCLAAGDIVGLGRLVDASHASLQMFGASTPALDRLVAAMREAGAAGARLTGAGFGGYAIAVCSPSRVEAVMAAGTDVGGRAFEVRPSRGLR